MKLAYHLVHANVSHVRAPLDDPLMKDFFTFEQPYTVEEMLEYVSAGKWELCVY
jgi:hypothetical protein